jgi:hypothetical protein
MYMGGNYALYLVQQLHSHSKLDPVGRQILSFVDPNIMAKDTYSCRIVDVGTRLTCVRWRQKYVFQLGGRVVEKIDVEWRRNEVRSLCL